MKLLTVIVAHERVELTKRTVESYLETVITEHALVIANNGSTDGTYEYLASLGTNPALYVLDLGENVYPGAACNEGWTVGFFLPGVDEECTHLHRSDNDIEYLPDWCDEVERRFEEDLALGQLGLLEEKYEQGCPNVGGNSVIRRELWDAGLRWDESPWRPGVQEDTRMSAAVHQMGYTVGRVEQECVRHLGWDFDAYPDYYEASARARGLNPGWLRDRFDQMAAL